MTDSSETSEEREPFPEEGRLLGLDYGTKRIGLAVSTHEQTISSPLDNYHRRGEEPDVRYLCQMIEEYRIVGIVVGLPVHMSGDEGEKAREARTFGEWVRRETGRPVVYWDERFTSQQADDYLFAAKMNKQQRQARRDKLAAQIMLQSYLEAPDKSCQPPTFGTR